MADQSSQEDPLVAALPPATDYMTYLTLLEYQLTPQNLPTLSKLLAEDDGKLVEEIGWDLLRLVLPMLSHAPDEANQCLEHIARRGNPREVVVRVAEELEKLGDRVEDEDFDQEADDDEMPTFAGEAPHVHLGTMKLDGMPEATQPVETGPADGDADEKPPSLLKELKLRALFNMLGSLHPRIKTQYPSRFLATSLPAALGAYRQIPISGATTTAFLTMLETLSGKTRPRLPPRASSAAVTTETSGGQTQGVTPTPASLPDPEAKTEEETTGGKVPSVEEKAIIFRLLNAVMLEVLDEYLSSLTSSEYPSMSWTARLRETFEPQRVLSGRSTETQLWRETEDLKQRDVLLARFRKLATDMSIDASQEIQKLVADEDDLENEDEPEEEASEYPVSPSQIPFPRNGIIFLHAFTTFSDPLDAPLAVSTSDLTKLIAHAFPLSATPTIPSPVVQDALLSLLYRHAIPHSGPNPNPHPPPSAAKFLLLISTLTQLFTITPWPSLRDSAHYIASKLLHAYPDADVRLHIITQTLRGDTLSTNWAETFEEDPATTEPGIDEETGLTRSTSALQPHPIPLAPPQQIGALKAVGADWLKDEFATSIKDKDKDKTSGLGLGLDPAILLTSTGSDSDSASSTPLVDLLFPTDLPTLSLNGSDADADSSTDASQNTLWSFLLDIPFLISGLNLLCVILPHLQSAALDLNIRATKHVAALSESSNFLLALLQHTTTTTTSAAASTSTSTSQTKPADDNNKDQDFLEESRADIFALEDACARATAALERTTEAA
ncbi:YAP1-binding protein 1 [Exophiala xenobiotica]|nr:YAP1-binding protein 1 [Exophiala xenobiotica]